MAQGKDPRDSHFVISIIKSTVRLLGCFLGIAFQSITVFAFLFLIAELLGIYEEL